MGRDKYTIRRFEIDDIEDILDLYHHTWFIRPSFNWFRWKYIDNPFIDHIPIFVAEFNEKVIGVKAFFALKLSINGKTSFALQPCDTMVHSDHRRQGLFTKMTEKSIHEYSQSDVDIFFNFPNQNSAPANKKMGWETIDLLKTYYRFQNPLAIVADKTDLPIPSHTYGIGRLLYNSPYMVRQRLLSQNNPVDVRSLSTTPADSLTRLYEHLVPDRAHVFRNERFYNWRFDNPRREYTTYLGYIDGELRGAIVTSKHTDGNEFETTRFVEILPLLDLQNQTMTIDALIKQSIYDNWNTDLFIVPNNLLPDDILSKNGFRSDSSFPISKVSSETRFMAKPLSKKDRITDLTLDSNEWILTSIEHDIS
ncbi:GNAT family N-acetyltransferase [Natronorubrum sp. JWXQ-INN-674]|uniref:GNAT family N-acetyltransferase n=1 Tax=Natronorubrum halalkaliphilum TaxID=2691917 RepID=A0A6B0VI49_9EURY|nr:GNAT family N-acetyltransferase [Natronorubrum halalkaliphilum]MXV60953.1 GNAT family N-acetyltransferase [Natronorubrum halalkaliphilum]